MQQQKTLQNMIASEFSPLIKYSILYHIIKIQKQIKMINEKIQ